MRFAYEKAVIGKHRAPAPPGEQRREDVLDVGCAKRGKADVRLLALQDLRKRPHRLKVPAADDFKTDARIEIGLVFVRFIIGRDGYFVAARHQTAGEQRERAFGAAAGERMDVE